MADYSSMTDSELVARLGVTRGLTPLETELAARLERALHEIDTMAAEAGENDGCDARRAGQVRRQAMAAGQRNLVLLPGV